MLKNKKAVIFDLDGSLVDSMWLWKEIDREYLEQFQVFLPEDLQEKIEGMSFTETAAYFKERFHLPVSVEEIKADWNRMAWEKYEKKVTLKPGAGRFLEYCRKKKVMLAIATSNSRHLVENLVRVLGISDYFSCIQTACDVKKGKPAPDVYLSAAGLLGVNGRDCLVFEDIVPGILAGKSAGMEVCAVEDAYSVYQREEKKRLADYYIQDFRQIAEVAAMGEE